MRLLDSVALARLRSLRLELRRLAAEGPAAGRHRGLLKGSSRDFTQHRPYAPGDELKSLDWKAYARQDRYSVREYAAESVLTTHVLLDASGSMAYCEGGRPPKFELACRLALALSYLVLCGGDAVGLSVFAAQPGPSLPPRSSLSQLEAMDELLSGLSAGGETDLGRALKRAAASIKRRCLVVLISDLLGEPEGVLRAARALRARRHELLVLQVLDPCERDFDYEGLSSFEDMERADGLACDPAQLRGAYAEEFERLLRFYEGGFHRCGIAYGAFFTGARWEVDLVRFLERWR